MSAEDRIQAKEKLDLLCSSAETIREKKALNAQMNELFKNTAEAVGVNADQIRKCKDYIHYHGRGMIDPLTVNKEEKEKFKDRVSPAFIKIREIITNCVTLGYEDFLQEYTDALKECGIEIKIDKSCFLPLTGADVNTVHDAVDAGCNLQGSICGLADQVRDVDAVTAENIDLVKKKDYKKVAEFFEKKDSGNDVEKIYTKENEKLELLGEAYQQIFYGTLKDNATGEATR